jgi:uncharacterized protein YodC (DUF2158 family)
MRGGMALIQNIFRKLGFLPPDTKYKPGDQVQLLEGGPIMIVEWVKSSPAFKTSILCCKWFDPKTQQTCMHVFTDDQVKQFDWYQAN